MQTEKLNSQKWVEIYTGASIRKYLYYLGGVLPADHHVPVVQLHVGVRLSVQQRL